MTADRPIYLDHSATTPCDPRVVERMLPYLTRDFGNAASHDHAFGWTAAAAVDRARELVAGLVNAHPTEIVWTSGATEANDLAIKGTADAYRSKGRHLVTCATEHKAVLDPMRHLEERGWELTRLPVDRRGHLDLDRLRRALRPDTVLVSVMAANNEIGTLHPVAAIGRIAKEAGTLFHTDATQAAGRIPLDVLAQDVHLMSLSAHKFYGPKGVGCLYVRRRRPRVRPSPRLHGGGHERGMRSGTLNVPGIVGMGEAARLCREALATEPPRLGALRDELERRILARLPDTVVNGDPEHRLPHLTHLAFPGVAADTLMRRVPGLAMATGSACTSAETGPSHVLEALGLDETLAHSALRLSLGRGTTREEVEHAADRLAAEVPRLREQRAGPAPAPNTTDQDLTHAVEEPR